MVENHEQRVSPKPFILSDIDLKVLDEWLSKRENIAKVLKDIKESLDKSDEEYYRFRGMDDGELDRIIITIWIKNNSLN